MLTFLDLILTIFYLNEIPQKADVDKTKSSYVLKIALKRKQFIPASHNKKSFIFSLEEPKLLCSVYKFQVMKKGIGKKANDDNGPKLLFFIKGNSHLVLKVQPGKKKKHLASVV